MVGRLVMVGVLQPVEAFIRNADKLIGLLAILREYRDAMVHVDADTELQGVQRFGKHGFDAAAKSENAIGVSFRQ
jgi:hypothetical protein